MFHVFSNAVVGGNIRNLVVKTTDNSLQVELYYDHAPSNKLTYSLKLMDKGNHTIFLERSLTKELKLSDKKKSTFIVTGLNPDLWTPATPNLYTARIDVVSENKLIEQKSLTIGFRRFEIKNGRFYLNGRPIFLKGQAINPPGRGIPASVTSTREFVEEYIGYLKSIHINIVRFPGSADKMWYDVCDEKGMMVFGGNYSGSVNGEAPPTNYDKAIEWLIDNKFAPIANHPSVMLYAINNEVPVSGKKGEEWLKFHTFAHQELLKWDSTRCYIANAGYGYGKAGDVCDLHRYWGWYYNSPFTFLNIRESSKIIPFPKPDSQPITFTECVGNYIGPTGYNNLTPDNKNPQSQLNWTGHASWDEQIRYANQHQSFTYKMATELFRRLRKENNALGGVFPFTIIFDNWNTIEKFSDMNPKSVVQQIRKSFRPILTSWECWTPNLYTGNTFHPVFHIVNDDDNFQDVVNSTFIYSIKNHAERIMMTDSVKLPVINYYDTYKKQLSIKIPLTLPMGWYTLSGKITKEGKVISENDTPLFIASNHLKNVSHHKQKMIKLYDPTGKTENAFSNFSVNYESIQSFDDLNPMDILVIGENCIDHKIFESAGKIKMYIKAGGRVLCLRQDSTEWIALNAILNVRINHLALDVDNAKYPRPGGASKNGYNINPERPGHPVFAGIKRENLHYWSDYTGWSESKKGFPAIHPVTNGFILNNKEDVASTAILANYGPGLNAIAIAEFFNEKGSVVVCGLDLVNRTGIDPIADQMLFNLVAYAADTSDHETYPLITSPVVWGDYESEKGLVTGEISGLLLNPVPRLLGEDVHKYPLIITDEGHQFAGNNRIGWADMPGMQYVPYGRRPFGPYYLRGMGSIAEIPRNADKTEGKGFFYCRIPAGKRKVATTVWNPSDHDLLIKIQVNELIEVSKFIPAKEMLSVECPVNSENIKMTFKGNRKLVLLQTVFE